MMTRSWTLIPVILLIHLILLTNTRFTLWPEMVVYPYLMNNGFALYRDIINPYPPLLTSFLAVFSRLFGYHPFPYQILTWALIVIIDLLVFFISRKIWGKNLSAYTSLIFFVLLSIPFSINGLWFDLLQTPLVLVSFYYFYQYFKKPQTKSFLFLSFFFLAVAFLIKQQILWLFFWYLLVLFAKFGKKMVTVMPKLILIPLSLMALQILGVILLWGKDVLGQSLYWVYYFPFFKASMMPGYILWSTPRQLLPLFFLLLLFFLLKTKERLAPILFMGTAGVLLLFAYPRFDYFHLVPSLSVLALFAGQIFQNFKGLSAFRKAIFLVSFLFLLAFSFRFLVINWGQEVRFFERDIFKAAKYIQEIIKPSDLTYIQNGPDQILPLAKRLPPKPWADEFPWYLELGSTQERIIASLEDQKPKFVIYKPYLSGKPFDLGVYRPSLLADYVDIRYRQEMKISDELLLKEL